MPVISNTVVPGVTPEILDITQGFRWQFEGVEVGENVGEDVIAGCEWVWEEGGLRCDTSITNTGAASRSVGEIRIRFLLFAEDGMEKVFTQSWTMSGGVGVAEAGGKCRSSGVIGWSNRGGTSALVAGFLDHAQAATRFEAERIAQDAWRVTAVICREGTVLASGAMLPVSPLRLRAGIRLSELLERYAGEVSSVMGKREKMPAESGWCSWYHFYGKETFDDVVSCAAELAGSRIFSSLRTIQIDDGWNRGFKGDLPEAWGDWEAHPEKFPEGMGAAARRIHELGFRAGLWLAPFAVARKSRLFVEHPDWLVQRRDPDTGGLAPDPTESPEIFQLDCTHPRALEWLRETFHRVFSIWNFDYVKIDFLHHGAKAGGVRFDAAATSVEAYRRGLRAINEAAGAGKFILGCGAPLLASVGLVDGMRVGPDVGGRWLFDPGWPDWPSGNCSLRAAAIPALWSQWMHGRLWQNDPDCLVVRGSPSPQESISLGRLESDTALKNPDYRATPLGLTEEEAGLWTRLVWMTGGLAFVSEVWSGLSAERRELLSKCFPAHGRHVCLLDWFECPDVAGLVATGKPSTVGLFNFGDFPCRPVIPAEKLGLSGRWVLRERWSGEVLQGEGDHMTFPELPPHSGRIWEEAT